MTFKTANGRLVQTRQRSQTDIDAHRHTLEMAEARTLYWTWQTLPEGPGRLEWLKKMLGRAEKLYGAGAGDRVRQYMGVVKREFE